jgi:hypothetical protein
VGSREYSTSWALLTYHNSQISYTMCTDSYSSIVVANSSFWDGCDWTKNVLEATHASRSDHLGSGMRCKQGSCHITYQAMRRPCRFRVVSQVLRSSITGCSVITEGQRSKRWLRETFRGLRRPRRREGFGWALLVNFPSTSARLGEGTAPKNSLSAHTRVIFPPPVESRTRPFEV